MKDIFITGTFRNDWNRAFNEKLCLFFEENGFSVFVPNEILNNLVTANKPFCKTWLALTNVK